MKADKLTSRRFERLTVVNRRGSDKNGHSLWECVCDCGNTVIISGTNLKSSHTTSCGCMNKEAITKHGLRNSPEYQSWKAMIQRCTNPKAQGYEYYGGRGITVCSPWLNSFEEFYADMGLRPSNGYSIDRIDNNKGYYKENCRWATSAEQNKNKRQRTKRLTI